jgi:hypothetical protein
MAVNLSKGSTKKSEKEMNEKFFYNPYKNKEKSEYELLEATIRHMNRSFRNFAISTNEMVENLRRTRNAMQYMGRSSGKTL